MYRYEVDEARKVIVLDIHGTQDGWEAKLVHFEWARRFSGNHGDWTLILDLSDYVNAQGDALKEQKKLAGMIGQTSMKKKMVIYPRSGIDVTALTQGANLETVDSFIEAWKMVGGEDRTVQIPPPADGTKYEAVNPPPENQ